MVDKWRDPLTGGWMRRQPSGVIDSSKIRIDSSDKASLRYNSAELYLLTKNCSDEVITHVPGFRYWEMSDVRKMSISDNKCGYQQRAFDFYWTIREGTQRGRIFLGIGTSTSIGPSTLGTDKFCGVSPDTRRYPEQGYPHMQLDADEPLPFFDEQFGGVIANHVFEHLRDQAQALREFLRVTKKEGVVCIVMPDATHCSRGCVDPTHTREFSADEFINWIKTIELPSYEVIEHNTFDNDFSFNTVLRRV